MLDTGPTANAIPALDFIDLEALGGQVMHGVIPERRGRPSRHPEAASRRRSCWHSLDGRLRAGHTLRHHPKDLWRFAGARRFIFGYLGQLSH